MGVSFFDPENVTVSFGGIQITGWVPDEFVRIESSAPDFIDVVGVYGEATRVKSKDHRATITFTLMQSSLSNDLLSVMNNIDHLIPNGAGVGAFMVIDTNGRSVYRAERAWISRSPRVAIGSFPPTREWTLSCENLIRFDGGM